MATITANLNSGTVVRISNGRHEWTADEPVAAGGTDTGPDPYELLLGSLAACTCATIALYCQHKGLTLKSISASYEFARIHADGRVEHRTDPDWFTPYQRRETVEWEPVQEAAE